MDELGPWIERTDSRLYRIENFVFGPGPNKAGNQPIFSFSTDDGFSGGYPFYFDGVIFEIRAMVVTPGTATTFSCHVIDETSGTLSLVTTLTIPAGQRTVRSGTLAKEVSNGDWGIVSLLDGMEEGDTGAARNLTVSWRVM